MLPIHNNRRLVDAILLMITFFVLQQTGFAINEQVFGNIYFDVAILWFTWFAAAFFTRLYKDRSTSKFTEEVIFVFNALFSQFILIAAILYVFQDKKSISSKSLLALLILFGLVQLTLKYFVRKRIHWSYYNDIALSQRLLVIGTVDSIKELTQTVKKHFYLGYRCVGYLSESDSNINDVPYFGQPALLKGVIDEIQIDKLIVALPDLSESDIRGYLDTCDAKGIKTYIVPNYHQYTSTSFEIDQIGLIPVINLRALPLDKFENKFLKRSFDIIFSASFLLCIGIWLFPLVALIIKLNSKGAVFFVQERWGINNKMIKCIKFRTMFQQDAKGDDFQHTTRNDPRITSIGKWLRKLNIDEMPQFFNVLMGSMSVVGPRPHVTPQNEDFMQKIDSYLMRHLIKPGITGWAQVNGARGEMSDLQHMQTRLNYDLYYIHRWTFLLDIQIILQTIINMFRGDDHAY
jgi:putative colanic acid biosysnthesis UDP-glucose lipid carrier transferase